MQSSSDVFRAAADYLERYGWIQGAFEQSERPTKHPKCCAVGAINMAVTGFADTYISNSRERGHSDDSRRYIRLFAQSLRLVQSKVGPQATPTTMVAKWNDVPSRTQEQVITALRKAAQK